MGGRRKRLNSGVAVSLFSFQDIITCLSGIVIFLMLFIAVNLYLTGDLKNRKLPVSVEVRAAEVKEGRADGLQSDLENDLEKKLAASEKKLKLLQSGLSDLKLKQSELEKRLRMRAASAERKSIALIPDADEKGMRKALIVECSEETIISGIAGSKEPPISFDADDAGKAELIKSLGRLKRVDEYVVFMIKPSAAGYAMDLVGRTTALGLDVGYDALEESSSISFEESAR